MARQAAAGAQAGGEARFALAADPPTGGLTVAVIDAEVSVAKSNANSARVLRRITVAVLCPLRVPLLALRP